MIINSRQFPRLIFSSLIIILVASFVIITLTPYGAATSPDSISYLDVAKNIHTGNGLVLTDYHINSKNHYTPLTTWPPLYPLLLSTFTAPDKNEAFAASQMAILTLSISGLLMFLLLRPSIGNKFATVAALIFLTASPILTVFIYAWSESLFIPLLLFSSLCCLKTIKAISGNSVAQYRIYLLLMTVSLTMLVYCRYIGIFFAILWIPPAWKLFKKRKSWFLSYIIMILCYTALVSTLFIRNYYLTGHLSGTARVGSTKGLVENLADLIHTVFAFLPNTPVLLWISVLSALGITFYRWHRRQLPDNSNNYPATSYTSYLFLISIVSCTGYLCFLLLLRTITQFDAIDIRLISLIFPFLLIILFLTASRSWQTHNWRKLPLLTGSGMLIIMIAVQGISTYKGTLTSWQQHGSPNLPMNIKYSYNNFTKPPDKNLLQYIIQKLNNGKIETAVTERPKIFSFTARIKAKKFPSSTITPETIATINSIKNGVLILTSKHSLDNLIAYYGNKEKLPILTQYLKYNLLVITLPLPAN